MNSAGLYKTQDSRDELCKAIQNTRPGPSMTNIASGVMVTSRGPKMELPRMADDRPMKLSKVSKSVTRGTTIVENYC